MRKTLPVSLLFLLTMVLTSTFSYATHIFGGDLLYEYLSGTSYRVTLTIYGDCSGSAFPSLNGSRPSLAVMNGSLLVDRFIMVQQGSGIEVSPVCPDEIGNTSCKPGGTLPGVTKYIYTSMVNIPTASANWRFVFSGNMGATSAGRSNAITNLVTTSRGSLLYLEAELNNTAGPNSSPQYTSIPTPFFCINKSQQFNQGAIDSNMDSLSFSLIAAKDSGGSPVRYIQPFTDARPLSATTFTFDADNGQLAFLPNTAQTSVVVNKVVEYKNGVMVGSSMREMTFVVLDNCQNTPPAAGFDGNITGAANGGNNTINACQGTKLIAFKLAAKDPDGNNIEVTVNNVPKGATLTVLNNGTSTPSLDFTWNTVDVPIGTYNVFVNYKDDGCPLSSSQTIAYTIKVVKEFEVTHKVIEPTHCRYLQVTQLNITGGIAPFTVTLSRDNKLLRTYANADSTSNGTITDKYAPGTYIVNVSSTVLPCTTNYELVVVDSGKYPFPPAFKDPNPCIGSAVMAIDINDENEGDIFWFDKEGTPLDGAPVYTTDSAKIFLWLVSQRYKVCESDKVPFTVTVRNPPLAEILNKGELVCLGDIVYLQAKGGISQVWGPGDMVAKANDSSVYAKVMTATTYNVVVTDEYGCLDTAYITYKNIENCCTFSFPDAFTPNNDGKNDGYRIILYGNEMHYRLSIYNRWGQELFTTQNPQQYWDGNFGGKACDVGTYYYRVMGKCLTGQEKTQAGSFMLIR